MPDRRIVNPDRALIDRLSRLEQSVARMQAKQRWSGHTRSWSGFSASLPIAGGWDNLFAIGQGTWTILWGVSFTDISQFGVGVNFSVSESVIISGITAVGTEGGSGGAPFSATFAVEVRVSDGGAGDVSLGFHVSATEPTIPGATSGFVIALPL